MATVRSRFDKGKPASQWDERDKFQDDAIAIIERYHLHPFKDAYSITGQIYDDLVRPLKQQGEPLHMLLAASMMVQRLRQYASTLQGCCTVCSHHASDITGILDSFATDSKGSATAVQSNTKVGDTL